MERGAHSLGSLLDFCSIPCLLSAASLRPARPCSRCAEARKSKSGDTLRMHYVGRLYSDCSQFDESYYEGFQFALGQGSVIKGWDNGLVNMCVFEKRKLTVPANLAYGAEGLGSLQGYAPVPPNATPVIHAELLGLNGKAPKKSKGRQPTRGRARTPQCPRQVRVLHGFPARWTSIASSI